MSIVCIAEKKEQAGKIASALGLKAGGYGFVGTYRNMELSLVWGQGHLLELQEPKTMKDRVVDWRQPAKNLPFPRLHEVKIVPKTEAKARLGAVQNALKSAKGVICCTDPDDEGAVIFYRLIVHYKKEHLPLKHAVLDRSLSVEDIRYAFDHLQPFDVRRYYKGLYRGFNDWTYMLLTVGFTGFMKTRDRKLAKAIVGRVQTFALKAVDIQTERHESFVEHDYYLPTLKVKGVSTGKEFTLVASVKDTTLYRDLKQVEGVILKELRQESSSAQVEAVLSKRASNPHKLCNLAQLQKGFKMIQPAEVTKLADGLRFEGYSTYARTDYHELPDSMRDPQILKELLDAVSETEELGYWAKELRSVGEIQRIMAKKSLWRSAGMEHHAIVVTKNPIPSSLKGQTRDVYLSIAKNMLLSFSPDMVYNHLAIKTSFKELAFSGSLKEVVDPGWTRWERLAKPEKEADEEQEMKGLKELAADSFKVVDVGYVKRKASKPKLYDISDVIDVLTKPQRIIQMSKDEREIMDKYEGIGRPSTRDTAITNLMNYEYIEKVGGKVRTTPYGKSVLTHCPAKLYDAKVTIDWIKERENFMQAPAAEAYALFQKAIEKQLKEAESIMLVWDIEVNKASGGKTTYVDRKAELRA